MNILQALFSFFFTLTPQGTDIMAQIPTAPGTPPLYEATLDNGLKIIALPRHDIPQVALAMAVNVGAKHEGPGQKGLAHLLEHMIFKGTEDESGIKSESSTPRNDIYSESDINTIAYSCGAECNAFTSSDYTCYYFLAPSANWKPLLSILANSLTKCSLKEEHLASEFKAVIQELKIGRDRHTGVLFHQLCQSVFAGHPYHYPVIGYKEDIWNVHSKDLKDFYKEHYRPDNAVLVVVGDLEPSALVEYAATAFNSSVATPQAPAQEKKTPTSSKTIQETHYFHDTLSTKQVTIYRDVAQPHIMHAFCFKNSKEHEYLASLITSMLQSSTEGSLQATLSDELQLTTSWGASLVERFEYLMLIISYQPQSIDLIHKVDSIIQEYLDTLGDTINPELLSAALMEQKSSLMSLLNQNLSLALALGKATLTYGKPETVFAHQEAQDPEELSKELTQFCRTHLTRSHRHTGHLLGLSRHDAARLKSIQEEEDRTDTQLLAQRIRTTGVEAPVAAHHITIQEPTPFSFAKPVVTHLENNLTVLSCHRPALARTACILKLPFMVDPDGKEGIVNLLTSLLDEGTTNYTRQEFYRIIEKHGIDVTISESALNFSCFKEELPLCLDLIKELVTEALFLPEAITKVKTSLHKARERQQKQSAYKARRLYKNHCFP